MICSFFRIGLCSQNPVFTVVVGLSEGVNVVVVVEVVEVIDVIVVVVVVVFVVDVDMVLVV